MIEGENDGNNTYKDVEEVTFGFSNELRCNDSSVLLLIDWNSSSENVVWFGWSFSVESDFGTENILEIVSFYEMSRISQPVNILWFLINFTNKMSKIMNTVL